MLNSVTIYEPPLASDANDERCANIIFECHVYK
jgi:hypothetical protein